MTAAAQVALPLMLLALALAAEGARPQANGEPRQDPRASQAGPRKAGPAAKPRKVKAVLREVDLDHRSITIVPLRPEPGAAGGERPGRADLEKLELAFPAPAGSELIKLSKRAAKALGKKGAKKIPLEQLKAGSQLRVEYDPAAGRIIELVVEQAAF